MTKVSKVERQVNQMENKYFNEACDILDTAAIVASESGVPLDQALQAMRITAIMKVTEVLDDIDVTLYGLK